MDNRPKILLLGVTGQLGKLIAQHLQNNSSIELSVATRQEKQLPLLAQQYKNVVYLDLNQPNTFSNALQNVERLFLLTGYSVEMLAQSKTLIDAAKKAGVQHIVHLGVFSQAWDCSVPHFVWHQMVEVYIKYSQIKWTFLHPNCFLQNLLNYSLLQQAKLRWYTTKPCGWIALEDIAIAAAKILVEGPNFHHEKEYWLSTESFSAVQIAEILTQVTEKRVTPDIQPPESFLQELLSRQQNIDPYFYSVAESFNQIENGKLNYIGHTTPDIEILLNRKGISVQHWANLHKPALIQQIELTSNKSIAWGG